MRIKINIKLLITLIIFLILSLLSTKPSSAQSCSWFGESCSTDSECCANFSCISGVCQPTSSILLNEGAGMDCYSLCTGSGFEQVTQEGFFIVLYIIP